MIRFVYKRSGNTYVFPGLFLFYKNKKKEEKKMDNNGYSDNELRLLDKTLRINTDIDAITKTNKTLRSAITTASKNNKKRLQELCDCNDSDIRRLQRLLQKTYREIDLLRINQARHTKHKCKIVSLADFDIDDVYISTTPRQPCRIIQFSGMTWDDDDGPGIA